MPIIVKKNWTCIILKNAVGSVKKQCSMIYWEPKVHKNIGQYKEEPNWPETQDTKIRRRKTDRPLPNTQLGLNDSLLSKGGGENIA